MTSSISPSEQPAPSRVPRLALALLTAAVLAWVLGAVYTLRWNPEVAFFHRVHEAKRAWAAGLSSSNRVLLVGGSGCMTSIDPVRMREAHGLKVLNLGLGAGAGAKFLGRYAMDWARPGDRLILTIEPGILTGAIDWKSLGVQLAAANGTWQLWEEPGSWEWPNRLFGLRPGGQHLFTLLGKAVLRQPWYRYGIDEIRPGGWHEVAARREVPSPGPGPVALSPEARVWLADVKAECDRKGVSVAYAIPWFYGSEADRPAMVEAHQRFLADVGRIVPILPDPSMGVNTRREDYADSLVHPTGEAARRRTDDLARILRDWRPGSVPR